jgi:hypothetical protein
LKLRIGALENSGRGFEGLLFRFVEAQLKSEFDTAVSYDAGRAEGDVMETILAVHEGRDHEDRTLVTENCLADACDTGCDGEAGVAFEAGDLRAGVADAREELFLTGKSIYSRVEGERNSGDLGRTPHCHRRVSVFADDGSVHGTRIHVKFFAEDVAKTLGVEEGAGADDLTGGETGLPLGDEGEDVDGVRRNEKNAVEAFGHKFLDTTADDADVSGQHVEA